MKERIEAEIENKASFILNNLADQIADPEAIRTVREELAAKAEEEALQIWTEAKTKAEEEAKTQYRDGKVTFSCPPLSSMTFAEQA